MQRNDTHLVCGSGTHPGGEVTGVPGHNAAQAVLAAIPNGMQMFLKRFQPKRLNSNVRKERRHR